MSPPRPQRRTGTPACRRCALTVSRCQPVARARARVDVSPRSYSAARSGGSRLRAPASRRRAQTVGSDRPRVRAIPVAVVCPVSYRAISSVGTLFRGRFGFGGFRSFGGFGGFGGFRGAGGLRGFRLGSRSSRADTAWRVIPSSAPIARRVQPSARSCRMRSIGAGVTAEPARPRSRGRTRRGPAPAST